MNVITFDGDGTLWDISKVIRKALEKIAEIIHSRYPSVEVDIDEFYKAWEEVVRTGGDLSLYDMRRLSIHEVLKRHGIFTEDFGDDLFRIYLEERHSEIEIFPDTIPVLTELKKHFKIGLITNGNTQFQKYPIASYFDFTVRASEVGVSKPDPGIFEIAVKLAGVRKSDVLHIGDSLEEDYFGALNAGLNAVWLNRENSPVPPDVRSISSLSELLDLLNEIR